MFVLKTDAELEKMTSEERDVYSKAKAQHEAELIDKKINEAIQSANKDADQKIKNEVEARTKDNSSLITTLKETVEKQGEKIVELSNGTDKKTMKSLEEVFKSEYDKYASKTDKDSVVREGFTVDTKATASSDVMSVAAVNGTDFPVSGSTQATSAGVQTLYAKMIGFFGYRNPRSRILDLCDVQPLNDATLVVVNETVTGDAAVTAECIVKPIVKMQFATQEVSAESVPAQWHTTTKLRRFFPSLVNRILQKFSELVNDKIPTAALELIKAEAVAFTTNAAFKINNTPNNYDAIGAVIASLEALDKTPSAIVLHPFAWRNMKQEKTGGVYTLSNGNSISILQDSLDWGGIPIQIVKDPKIGIDEFMVGDFFDAVKVGVDTSLAYFETDGRTDGATTMNTGLSLNIRTHVIEKFFALIVPTPNKIGIVKDTFTNVKTLISI